MWADQDLIPFCQAHGAKFLPGSGSDGYPVTMHQSGAGAQETVCQKREMFPFTRVLCIHMDVEIRRAAHISRVRAIMRQNVARLPDEICTFIFGSGMGRDTAFSSIASNLSGNGFGARIKILGTRPGAGLIVLR